MLTVSSGNKQDAISDQLIPSNSDDPSSPHFDWWPSKGTSEWVQFHFLEPSRVSEVSVYWFDDTGTGQCRIPESWQILYRDGESWKPVQKPSAMKPEKDAINRVTFQPVETTDLRLSVKLQDGFSGGLYEWSVR
jgi:hypothetical protein